MHKPEEPLWLSPASFPPNAPISNPNWCPDRVGVTDGKCRYEALTLPMSIAWCLQLFGVASISSRGWFDSSQGTHGVQYSRLGLIVGLQPFRNYYWRFLLLSCQLQGNTAGYTCTAVMLPFSFKCFMLVVLCAAHRPELGFMPAALWRAHGPITHAHVHTQTEGVRLIDKDHQLWYTHNV